MTVIALLLVAPILMVLPGPVMAQDNVLSVTRTQETINIDGVADETSWVDAIPAAVDANKGAATVTVELKALYDAQYIYILAKWQDQSKSVIPQQWQYTGGVWYSAPHKEDRLSFLWNTADAIVGFEQNKQGCMAACHSDMFSTQTAAEKGDLWEWLAGRTNPSASVPDIGWMDDMSVQSTGVVPDDFTGSKVWEANSVYAHDTDPATVPFSANDTPKWTEGNTPPNPDPNFLFRGYETDIVDPDSFDDGTTLPGYLLSRPSTGLNRADIAAKGMYDDAKKMWTMEIKRKLVTGNDNDVAFSNLLNPYHFGLAVFDNKGAGTDTHFKSELVTMRFDVPELNLLSATPALTSPIIGDRVNVSVHLKNQGGYSTGFNVAMYLDETSSAALASRPYTELKPSEEDEFNFSWDTAGMAPGKHMLLVKVDSDGIIPEHDENNNVIETEVWLFPPISTFKASKKSAEVGQKVKLMATITNPAEDEANVTVVFYEGDTILDTQNVNVSGNDELEVTFIWKAKKAGKHTFKVELQGATNTAKEFNVKVTEESPGPGLLLAAVALSLAAGMAVSGRRRGGR